jgi:hypothetical protein
MSPIPGPSKVAMSARSVIWGSVNELQKSSRVGKSSPYAWIATVRNAASSASEKPKHSSHVSGVGAPRPGGCADVVARCNSIVGFAVWEVIGAAAEPDSSCCDIVPPQLPTPTALSMLLESNIGFKQSLLTAAA